MGMFSQDEQPKAEPESMGEMLSQRDDVHYNSTGGGLVTEITVQGAERACNQINAYPEALDHLVANCKYREGWRFRLYDQYNRGQGSVGTTLEILIDCVDTYKPEEDIRIRHTFIVPAASYNERSWRRWLFECILNVEKHEAMEFFQIAGERPYAPNHGPGHDPYTIFEEGTRQEKRTSYLGEERDTDSPHPETDADFRMRIIMEARKSTVQPNQAIVILVGQGVQLDNVAASYGLKRLGV